MMNYSTITIASDRPARVTVSSAASHGARISGSAYVFSLPTPGRPLAHRTDLPEHERQISAESYGMLRQALASAANTTPRPLPFALPDDEEG